ncbi:MAG: hypothetical protein LAP85_08695 [Acidobacteriia bacterium]|nr:hypothetical protein [Terriglobia bacterium]
MKKSLVFFLLLASFGVASCAKKESSNKEEAKAVEPAARPSDVSPQLLALLPAKNEVPGWAMSQKPRSFKAGDLYEYIDGAADSFLAYGFQEVASADYKQDGTGYEAVVEIYQMKDPLNAFGKYTEERNPGYQFLKIGNEGYSGGTSVNFWSGPYYVKITTFDEKDAIKQEMTKLANAVAGKVPAAGAEPAEVSYFPKENQMPHTIAYIPKDVLAQSYFTNGFEARYKADAKEYKMILVTLESPAAAQDALARYRQFLSTGGKDVKDLKSPGEGGFSGRDSFYGNMAAIRAGKNIVVALGIASEEAGKKLIAELLAHIK